MTGIGFTRLEVEGWRQFEAFDFLGMFCGARPSRGGHRKLEAAIATLQGDGIARRGVAVGDHPKLPVLDDVDGRPVDRAALNAVGPLVVTFYRGGWCPYCNVELRGLQRIDAELRRHGAAQVAVTPEAPSHGATTVAEAG